MGWIFLGLVVFWLVLLWWLCTPFPGEEWPILAVHGKNMEEAHAAARRYGYAANFGIRLVIVTAEENRGGMEKHTKAEIWTPEEYLGYLETERNRIAGTGNGNHPGRDQRCGLSEL